MRTLVIGVDGGGSKTALVAADAATGRAVVRRPPLPPESGAAIFAADALGLSRNPPR